MLLRKSKKRYLEKMRCGEITCKEVADIFKTSENNVQKAFVEYSQRKNPFKLDKLKRYIGTTEVFISCVSMLLVLFTLFEMQVARNHTYMPDLYFEKTTVIVTWDSNGLKSENNEKDDILESYAQTTKYIDTIPLIKLTNIGVGTAKKIRLEWKHNDNMKELSNYLYVLNKDVDFMYNIDKSFTTIKSNDTIRQTSSKPVGEITYMKNEDQNHGIVLPYEYLECIRHTCYNYKEGGLKFPDIEISVRYYDIQNKVYHSNRTIQLKLLILTRNPDGSGYAVIDILEK